ncbi:MAG: DUF4240 domain-containing protein [Bryobacteraceae bacterium]
MRWEGFPDKAQFWNLIDTSRASADGDPWDQIEVLRHNLSPLEPDELVAFDHRFWEYHERAFTWELWGAAFIIGNGCGDDGFIDFRAWLISRGEQAFEAALADPETLVNVIKSPDGDCQIEGIQYVARAVWEGKTGKGLDDFPELPFQRRSEPSGTEFQEDEAPQRYPNLARVLRNRGLFW